MTFAALSPSGYRYRALKRGLSGWDVFALQTGLTGLGFSVGGPGADGILGPATEAATIAFQRRFGLTDDGIAGVITQREIALQTVWPLQHELDLPKGLMRGQIEAETSYWLGDYSELHTDTEPDTFDIGVCQLNTPVGEGYEPRFNVANAIRTLAGKGTIRPGLRQAYDEYKAYGKITDERRLWELAAGSWNAPSWTRALAKGGTLSPTARESIEGYISRVTVYMEV